MRTSPIKAPPGLLGGGAEAREPAVVTRWLGTGENKREALALRYRAYRNSGLIPSSPWGLYADAHDDLPTTLTAALHRHGRLAATLRLCVQRPGAAPTALPCAKVYPEMQGLLAAATGTVVEISRLALDPDITNQRMRARIYAATIRNAILAAIALDARQILVATHTKWRRFYQLVMDFDVAGEPQFYPPGDVPVVLLSRRIDAALERRIKSNSFFKVADGELEAVRAEIAPLMPAA